MNASDFQKELIQTLNERFTELGFDTRLVPDAPEGGGQIGDTLAFLMPITERGDRVLTELRFAVSGGETYYVQIFTTLFTELNESLSELERLLGALNYKTGFGAYGVLHESGLLWHKYGCAVREFDFIDGAEGFAVALLDILDLIREQYTAVYGVLTAVASGAVAGEQALSDMMGLSKQ